MKVLNGRVTILSLVGLLFLVNTSVAGAAACDNEEAAGFGLCTSYCVHMKCGFPDQSAAEKACDGVKQNFQRITGRALSCDPDGPWLRCSVSDRYLYCVAGGLEADVFAYLNRDETTCNSGWWPLTGLMDMKTNADGIATFRALPLDSALWPQYNEWGMPYMGPMLTPCNENSIALALTNQPGEVLARTTVNF